MSALRRIQIQHKDNHIITISRFYIVLVLHLNLIYLLRLHTIHAIHNIRCLDRVKQDQQTLRCQGYSEECHYETFDAVSVESVVDSLSGNWRLTDATNNLIAVDVLILYGLCAESQIKGRLECTVSGHRK